MAISRQQSDFAQPPADALDAVPVKGPRARTQRLMLQTATELMQHGHTPSVNEVAEEAGVSRATAYRYFPSQLALVQSVVNEVLGPITNWEPAAEDAEERLTDLLTHSLPLIDEFEATFRAALKIYLEQWANRKHDANGTAEEFKRGHRLKMLNDAVSPLKGSLGDEELERLVGGLSALFGIETIVVLKDINGMDSRQTRNTIIWAAKSLVRQAIMENQ